MHFVLNLHPYSSALKQQEKQLNNEGLIERSALSFLLDTLFGRICDKFLSGFGVTMGPLVITKFFGT
jgi:hypothetical protein